MTAIWIPAYAGMTFLFSFVSWRRMWVLAQRGLYILILFLLLSQGVFAAEQHGLVSVDDYYSDDSSSAYDIHVLTTRIRWDAIKLNEEENLSFHFDGRERFNIGSKDYNSGIKQERIDVLNFEYTGISPLYIAAGRLWPKELYIERADGINLVVQGKRLGVGIFAGTKPDPYTEALNSDFSTAGGYIFCRRDDLFANLAYIYNGYNGRTDREYIYGQSSLSPLQQVSFYGSFTVDINQFEDKAELTNAMAEISFRPDFRKSLTVGYNQFRAFRLYRSMDFDIEDSRQQSYYLRGDYRLLDRYTVYGKYERQTLHYQTLEPELSASDIYQMGFRNDNLFNRHIDADVSMIIADNYSSGYTLYNLQASRFLTEAFQLMLSGSSMETRYDLTESTDQLLTYGISGYWSLNRKWSLSLSYEGRDSKDYATDTLLSRISYKF